MATETISIHNFLSHRDKRQFNIPLYQRPYSWRNEHIEELFSDIKIIVESQNNSNHFMGLIVMTPPDPQRIDSFDLIDGQQRITSLCLFLVWIRDHLHDIFENNSTSLDVKTKSKILLTIGRIDECLYFKLKGIDDIKLSTQNEKEYEAVFLQNILCSIPDLDAQDPRYEAYNKQPSNSKNTFSVKYSYMTDKQRFNQRKARGHRALRNYGYIDNLIKNDDVVKTRCQSLASEIEFYCEFFASAILDNTTLIDFVSKNYSDAFNTFSVLNNRGLSISSTDLIKNLCLKKANSSSEQMQLIKIWKQIFDEELDNKDDIQFLRYSYNSRNTFITKSELYDKYESLFDKMTFNQIKDFLEYQILCDASNFNILKNSSFKNTLSIELGNAIKLLQSTKSTQWYSICLSALRGYNKFNSIHVSRTIQKLFELVHEIVFSIILSERKANIIEKKFPEFAVDLNSFSNEKELLSIIDKVSDELNKFKLRENLNYSSVDLNDVDFTSNNLNGNIVLFLINYHRSGTSNLALKSLEHILPQSADDKKWPIIKGLSPLDIELHTYSLGNFLLIDQPLNSSVKASSYDKKRVDYKNRVIDPLPSSSKIHISKLATFDLNTIQQRAKEIIIEYKKIS